nr:MAG TPA: hypothetical protein [Caudoviricetes sp.]
MENLDKGLNPETGADDFDHEEDKIKEEAPTETPNVDELIKEHDLLRQRVFDLENDVKVRDKKIEDLKAENYRMKVTSSHSREYHEEVKAKPQTRVNGFDDFMNNY